jgi:serine protease inhibitor
MKSVLFSLILVILFQSCNLFNQDDNNALEISDKAKKLITSNNQFGFDLFTKVYAYEEEAENIMISPLSVALALAMTYNGAEGETRVAMEETLRLSGLSREQINESYKTLVDGLQSLDKKVLLEIANAIFYRQDFAVEADFVKVNSNYYSAEVSPLDFGSSSALETINGWVNKKTHTKIPEIIKEITPSHVMFLLNAIYFKGTWTKEFNKKSTKKQLFTYEDGSFSETDMMHRLDTVDYYKGDDFSMIRLPYGKQDYNMYLLLPEQANGLSGLVSQLTPANWEKWQKGVVENRSVDIMLPRFKFPYEIKLNDVLAQMGMGVAFTGAADFTGINRDGGLRIDYVKHKSFIEVNEEGTEAAAVTIVIIERTSAGDNEKTFFHANHPFLFMITEKSTGAILFMGTVKRPNVE